MALPNEMNAIVAAGNGGPETLHVARLPVPSPGPGEVLIRVTAAGVNAPDLAQRAGLYPPPPGASPLLGLEVSGEIAHDAGPWKEGDYVVALCNGGGYAEYVAVPVGQVLPAPLNWPLIDAAALPETWFTITQTLVMRAGLSSGMSLLVSGAAGGLGGAAIQIAKILGADPIAIVSSAAKADYATALGARAVIRRDTEDIVARALELTGGKGVDRVLDTVGASFTAQMVLAAARFGHIALAATQAGGKGELPLNKIVAKQLTLSGSTLRPQSAATKAAIAAHLLQHLWPSLPDPALPHPKLLRLPLAAAADAHRAMEDPAHYGKVVLVVG
ncbi:MAG: zinc-binding dehydrogenase [Devosia sp.]